MVPRSVLCSALLASAVALGGPVARAEDASPPAEPPHEDVPPGLRGPRIGFTPGLGFGFLAFTGNVAFPSSVFTTVLQGELLVELTRVGFFLRGGFLSSGASGRWTAPIAALGGQYRLIGDGEERWGVIVRSAILYERWAATSPSVGCDVLYFFPNSCQDYVEPPDSLPSAPVASSIRSDDVGVLEGLRLEAPLEDAYIAFDGEVSIAGDVDSSSSGGTGVAIAGQLVLTFGLRAHPNPDTRAQPIQRHHYYQY